ncbi:unnamed protein product [Zymoseptoria tritici ST99CH_1E4]|uniref:Uncharacterized protein n=1 Tax=Zymoseptoria tritici ST99CH_1E4 TaxID=1276532 RepID=A0A2H1H8T8_ZYMTR|nr:unnamed protein product [Zymoseptoria tritici ST99CH_1E4]
MSRLAAYWARQLFPFVASSTKSRSTTSITKRDKTRRLSDLTTTMRRVRASRRKLNLRLAHMRATRGRNIVPPSVPVFSFAPPVTTSSDNNIIFDDDDDNAGFAGFTGGGSPSPSPSPAHLPPSTPTNTNTTIGRPVGSGRARLYEPTILTAYYAKHVNKKGGWDNVKPAQQRKISHVARLEEGIASVARSPACSECRARVARGLATPCRVYTAAEAAVFDKGLGAGKCARCRFRGDVQCV